MQTEIRAEEETEAGRKSASFLVRVWSEAEEDGAPEDGQLRVYVKDLQTGEEAYLKDPAGLGDCVKRSLED